ncbi:MAG: T9SS type A sorting domain-containing protein [Bacteroidia bacterium]
MKPLQFFWSGFFIFTGMKKLLLLLILCFPFALFAQQGWTSVFIEADSSKIPFEILDTINIPLYPDSSILNGVNEFKGCPIKKQHNIHGIGQSFDFVEHQWISSEQEKWTRSTEIDSIYFNYHYHRNSGANVIDTLIVQLSKNKFDKDSAVSVPTKKNGTTLEHIQTLKIPLSDVDKTLRNGFSRNMAVQLIESFNASSVSITISFKNGKNNDSLVAKDTLNSANIFSITSYAVKKSEKPPIRFNNGLLLTTEGKYLNSVYSRSFLELHGDSVELYPAIYFKYNNYEIGFSDKEAHDVSVFPTLLKPGEPINIKANSFVSVSIFGLNGKLLHSSTTNQISTSALTKGIYLLKVATKNASVSKRIVVN